MFETAMFLELLEKVRDRCHRNSKDKGFWDEQEVPFLNAAPREVGGLERVLVKEKPWSFGEKIALIHSELSEMFEAWRKNKTTCDKNISIIDSVGVRQITAIEEEVADTFIRLLDLCGKLDIDVGRVVLAKMAFNEGREHMHGGRKC
jgi:NTP pyrophosphatase (non-canonical NTP hydrolase)